jgi:hypothetical protein
MRALFRTTGDHPNKFRVAHIRIIATNLVKRVNLKTTAALCTSSADSPSATAFAQPWLPRHMKSALASILYPVWRASIHLIARPPQRRLRPAPEESNRGEGVDRDREGAGREQAARIDRRREE